MIVCTGSSRSESLSLLEVDTSTLSCPALCPAICGHFVFGQVQGSKPLRPARHASPTLRGEVEGLVSTDHAGDHGRETLHPKRALGDQLGQLLDDPNVAHLESISQLQLLRDHPASEILLVCRNVFSNCSPFGGSFQHELRCFLGTLHWVNHLHQSRGTLVLQLMCQTISLRLQLLHQFLLRSSSTSAKLLASALFMDSAFCNASCASLMTTSCRINRFLALSMKSSVALIWWSTGGTAAWRWALSRATCRLDISSVSSARSAAIDALILDTLSVAAAQNFLWRHAGANPRKRF